MTLMPPKAAGRSDIFQTPSWPVEAILEYIPKDWLIWEPACGEGLMVETMKNQGYDVIGTDIMNGFDFLSPMATKRIDYDCIITNPPYSTKDQWLEVCFLTGLPFALLLPVTAIGEQKRFKLYKEHGIQILLLPERVHFVTPSGEGSGSWFSTAWFCRGLDLPSQIHCSDVVVPEKEKEPAEEQRCSDTEDMFVEEAC